MTDATPLSQLDRAIIGLRSLIMSGEVEAQSRLPEVALAERLGTSRTPLRQAMDRLVAEGLLERISSGGCRVASFDLDDITDAIELRGVIEGTAARLAAERGADADLLAAADQVLDGIDLALRQPERPDFDAYFRLNSEFHVLLSKMAKSAIIEREVDRVCRLPLASPGAFLQEQELIPDVAHSLPRAQHQHRSILDAIRNREGARAEGLVREHARLARENLDFLTQTAPHLARQVPGMALVTGT